MKELIRSQFYDYLEKFLEELNKSFPQLNNIIENKYSDVKQDKYIDEIKENLYKFKEEFLGKEEELNDLFKNNEIILLDEINLSELWNKSDSDNKSAIIQYIKVFIFIFETLNKNTEEDEEDKMSGGDMGDMGDFEKMLKDSLLDNESNLKSFCKNLNENDNSIINLAKDIAGDLKNDTSMNDNNITDFMSNDGKGLNSLITKITSRIDKDLKSGNIDQNKLISDAQKMMGANGGLFGNLFNGMNFNQNMKNNFTNNQSNVQTTEKQTTEKQTTEKQTTEKQTTEKQTKPKTKKKTVNKKNK